MDCVNINSKCYKCAINIVDEVYIFIAYTDVCLVCKIKKTFSKELYDIATSQQVT